MLRRVGLPLLCLAMFTIAGGHWLLLQSIAWAQMIRDYSRDTSLVEAVEMTFSGKQPCAMCVRINEGKNSEQKQPATVKLDKKSEFPLGPHEHGVAAPPSVDFAYDPVSVPAPPARFEEPPQPIPILA